MPKCGVCKTIYNEPQRQKLLTNNIYWCAFCCRFKIFNPFPPNFFPERNPQDVLNRQKERYDYGKNTKWYKN